jgi:hypothetical protein
MATSIPITSVSNQTVVRDASSNITSISGTGAFDTLLASFSAFVELQEQNGKLSQSQYAEILSQSLPAILNASLDFVTRAPLVEQQIEGLVKDNLVKDQQILESTYKVTNLLPKELEKITSEISLSTAQISGITKDNLVKDQQVLESTYKVLNILPKELEKITNDIALGTAQISGITKDNLVKDQQVLESVYNVTNMLPKQLEKITSEISMTGSQKSMIDQQKLTEVQNTAKASYEVITMLPAQKLGVDADTAAKTSQKAMIDQQKLTEIENTAKANEEIGLVYVTKIAKDKEAALLGLDDVALMARQAQTGASVYVPKYTNGL